MGNVIEKSSIFHMLITVIAIAAHRLSGIAILLLL
jgi:hypothetical protein